MQLPKLIKSSKKERKQYTEEGFSESLIGVVKATGNSLKTDLLIESSHEAWDELLLAEDKAKKENDHNSGDLDAGHEVDFSKLQEKAHQITDEGKAFASEVIHAGERAQSQNSQEISIKVQEILIEMKQLANSSGQLQKQVEVMAIEQMGDDPGIYHLNFVEQMLQTIRDIRLKVDDSLAWFGALRGKKAARQYQSMAKKHGTSFTLSNERTAATQTG